MPITPTHIATNKKTGERVRVEYDQKTGEYQQNWMVCLSVDGWDIEPIINTNPPSNEKAESSRF